MDLRVTPGNSTEEEAFKKIDDALAEFQRALAEATSMEAMKEITDINERDTGTQFEEW